MYYLLVNIGDVLQGYLPGFVFLGEGLVGNLYRLGADVLSVSVLVGMLVLMVRRYAFNPPSLSVRESTTLHPKARSSIRRDSAIVGVFILLHVGARFLGESFHLAQQGADAWQPFASAMAAAWSGLGAPALEIGRHASWWLALGLILAFLPYFPQSKHIHLFFAPLNYLLRPQRSSLGQLSALDFEDESIEQFGAARIEDLSYSSIMDAYACIMCNRCQDACPAYETGKVLSPAALEINKRYYLNEGLEWEVCAVLKATLVDTDLDPDPAEIGGLLWVDYEDIHDNPRYYRQLRLCPWFEIAMRRDFEE
jgi:ferredoxin